MANGLQHERAESRRLDGLEDEFDRDQVGQVANRRAASCEGPRQLKEDPQRHLNQTQHAAEAEARVDQERELDLTRQHERSRIKSGASGGLHVWPTRHLAASLEEVDE